jgi:hypothetical protein
MTMTTCKRQWTLCLPPSKVRSGGVITYMELLSDPGPQWLPLSCQDVHPSSPNADHAAGYHTNKVNKDNCDTSHCPFYLAQGNRMIALMVTISDEGTEDLIMHSVRFNTTTSILLQLVRSNEGTPLCTIPWQDWGPASTRAEPMNDIWDGAWPVCVYGMRFITFNCMLCGRLDEDELASVTDDGPSRRYRQPGMDFYDYEHSEPWVEIFDYNQVMLGKAVLDSGVVVPSSYTLGDFFASLEPVDYEDVVPLKITEDGFDYYLHPTYLPPAFANLFDDPDNVCTRLPYRVCRADQLLNPQDPSLLSGGVDALMLSEDSIVLVRVSATTIPESTGY